MDDPSDTLSQVVLDNAREIYASILLTFLHHKKYINLQTYEINKYFGIALRKVMPQDVKSPA